MKRAFLTVFTPLSWIQAVTISCLDNCRSHCGWSPHFQHHPLLQSTLQAAAKVWFLNVTQIMLPFCLKHLNIHIPRDGPGNSTLSHRHSPGDLCCPSLSPWAAPPASSHLPTSLQPPFHLWTMSCPSLPLGLHTFSSLHWHFCTAGYCVVSVSPKQLSQAAFLKNPNPPVPLPILISVIFLKALSTVWIYFPISVLSFSPPVVKTPWK